MRTCQFGLSGSRHDNLRVGFPPPIRPWLGFVDMFGSLGKSKTIIPSSKYRVIIKSAVCSRKKDMQWPSSKETVAKVSTLLRFASWWQIHIHWFLGCFYIEIHEDKRTTYIFNMKIPRKVINGAICETGNLRFRAFGAPHVERGQSPPPRPGGRNAKSEGPASCGALRSYRWPSFFELGVENVDPYQYWSREWHSCVSPI